MIKVIALATAFVQTTPTGWVCLLSDLTANVCHLLDVAWCFCSFPTFLHVKSLENLFSNVRDSEQQPFSFMPYFILYGTLFKIVYKETAVILRGDAMQGRGISRKVGLDEGVELKTNRWIYSAYTNEKNSILASKLGGQI